MLIKAVLLMLVIAGMVFINVGPGVLKRLRDLKVAIQRVTKALDQHASGDVTMIMRTAVEILLLLALPTFITMFLLLPTLGVGV